MNDAMTKKLVPIRPPLAIAPELRAFNPDDLAEVRRAFDTATPASSPEGWLAVLYQFEFWWGERLSRRSPAKADPREPARQ